MGRPRRFFTGVRYVVGSGMAAFWAAARDSGPCFKAALRHPVRALLYKFIIGLPMRLILRADTTTGGSKCDLRALRRLYKSSLVLRC